MYGVSKIELERLAKGEIKVEDLTDSRHYLVCGWIGEDVLPVLKEYQVLQDDSESEKMAMLQRVSSLVSSNWEAVEDAVFRLKY